MLGIVTNDYHRRNSNQCSILIMSQDNEAGECFGSQDISEHYAFGVCSRYNFAVKIGHDYSGLLLLDLPCSNNANIYCMAILPEYHDKGIGHYLIKYILLFAKVQRL